LQSIDCFHFMDADYKDNRELMQELIKEENAKIKSQIAPRTQGRTRRIAHL
jgi:hypothetical protein